MPSRQPSRLAGCDYWETRHPDEAVLALSRQQRNFRQKLATGKGYLLSTNTAQMEWLTFSSIWTPTPQEAWAEEDNRNYIMAFWNEGWNHYRNGRHGRVAASEGLLVTPYMESYWKSSGDRDVLTVSISSRALLDEAQALAGRPIPRLESTGLLYKSGPIWRFLDRFLQQLESGRFRKPTAFRSERQLRLITAVALAAPHNIQFREEHAHNLPPLHKLRFDRAMQFMEANLTVDISLGNIAAAAGTSERELQRVFKSRHKTPLAELHALRMHAARRDLLAPEEGATVNSVVQKYVLDPSRFAQQHFEMFGEYPHMTLQLGRLGRRVY